VASKFYEDFYIDNDSWGRITGVNLQEINRLERKFLAYIDFRINTQLDWFLNYVQLLLSYAVENSIIQADMGLRVLQSMMDAAVLEIGESDTA
jgi:hypothetical protein